MTGYKAPTSAQIAEAIRRIPTPALRRAFFERLKNPLWVEPLARAGMFSNPPEPEVTDEGLVLDHYWPEIDYLIRVSPAAPQAVVDVLLKLVHSNNPWVRRAAFTIGAGIPANEAARLKPLLKDWETSSFGWRTDPRDMVTMAVNLLDGGQRKMGKWMANLLFRPTASDNKHKPNLAIDEHWYQEGLPRVVDALGEDAFRAVMPWLEAYERCSGRLTDKLDFTEMSRDSIRHRSDHYPSVEQTLIDTARDLAADAMSKAPRQTWMVLAKSPMRLALKITLYALTEAFKEDKGQNSSGDELLTVGEELLADSDLFHDSYRIEVCELAREMAQRRPAALGPLLDFVIAGPRMELDGLRERLRRDDEDSEEELDLRVETVLAGWKHRWLSSIGSKALPPELKSVLAEMDTKFGTIDSPLLPENRVTGWTGPNSPLSRDDMSVMSPEELVSHLGSWHDTGDGWGPEPSHEGQGRELAALLTTNPRTLQGTDNLVDRLRPTYLRAILQGWEAALKAGLEFDWSEASSLISDVLTHSDTSSFPVEGGNWDDDVDFRWAKTAAVSLLEEIVKKRESPHIPKEFVSIFADLLIRAADDETAWLEYESDESEMDPLNLSINRQWPIRLHGLVNLMAHGRAAPWYGVSHAAFEREINRLDEHGASSAIVGESLGRLLSVDPEWLRAKSAELFGTVEGLSRNQQIALTTAVAVNHYHPELYDLLSPGMIAAVRLAGTLVAGWQGQSPPLQRIGEWVVDAIIYGDKIPDDPLAEAFFTRVEPKIRGAAIGRIAWSFMHAQSVDTTIRDRLASLWDARVAYVRSHNEARQELDEFYWFVRSGKFDSSWWLPRLKEAVELDPELAAQRYVIGKQIASAADSDPRGAFEATKVLLTVREEDSRRTWGLTRNAVPMVIARAVASNDDHLKDDAIRFMNKLGEEGSSGLEQEVDDVLNGKITQNDVGE